MSRALQLGIVVLEHTASWQTGIRVAGPFIVFESIYDEHKFCADKEVRLEKE